MKEIPCEAGNSFLLRDTMEFFPEQAGLHLTCKKEERLGYYLKTS
jgi:hypothetical protein